MKHLIPFTVLGLALCSGAIAQSAKNPPPAFTDLKHVNASVHVPGKWQPSDDGNAKDLVLKSAGGQKLVVSVDTPRDPIPLGQIRTVANFVLNARLQALQLAGGGGTLVDTPDTQSSHELAERTVRTHSPKKKSRVAVRVEVTATSVRTTYLFDDDSKADAEFADWSKQIFDGVK